MPSSLVTTDLEPIIRRFGGYLRATTLETIAVADIDTDFARYPEFTEAVVDALLAHGTYDDSDGTDTTCVFSTDRPDAVRRQWRDLGAAHAEEPYACRHCGEPVGGDLGNICATCDAEDAANAEEDAHD